MQTCPEVPEEADGELQRWHRKPGNECVWFEGADRQRGPVAAQSCSRGRLRGKHITEKMLGARGNPKSLQQSPGSSLQPQGVGMSPGDPRTTHCMAGTATLSLPDGVASSK